MWEARDIKDKIITRLQDTNYGISAYITAINTERGETTEIPLQVNAEQMEGQYPLVFVDLGDSQIQPSIGTNYEDTMETFSMEVTAVLKGNNTAKLKDDCENYIRAILKSLQGYSEQSYSGSYICQANSILRADIDTEQDETVRAVTINFSVYANQI